MLRGKARPVSREDHVIFSHPCPAQIVGITEGPEPASEPIQHLAKKYDVSGIYLAEVYKKFNILPQGRGHWDKYAGGKSMKQPVLPELSILNLNDL
jgi:hypothetical protein